MGFEPTKQAKFSFRLAVGIPSFAGLRPTGIKRGKRGLAIFRKHILSEPIILPQDVTKQKLLAGLDIVDPETGGIRQDLAEKAQEFWSSEGQTQYEATRDTSITNRMVVQLEPLERYLSYER